MGFQTGWRGGAVLFFDILRCIPVNVEFSRRNKSSHEVNPKLTESWTVIFKVEQLEGDMKICLRFHTNYTGQPISL